MQNSWEQILLNILQSLSPDLDHSPDEAEEFLKQMYEKLVEQQSWHQNMHSRSFLHTDHGKNSFQPHKRKIVFEPSEWKFSRDDIAIATFEHVRC